MLRVSNLLLLVVRSGLVGVVDRSAPGLVSAYEACLVEAERLLSITSIHLASTEYHRCYK